MRHEACTNLQRKHVNEGDEVTTAQNPKRLDGSLALSGGSPTDFQR